MDNSIVETHTELTSTDALSLPPLELPDGASRIDALRSQAYALLAVCFSFPGPRLVEAAATLSEFSGSLFDLKLDTPIKATDLERLEAEYINVLDGMDKRRKCAPYEGAWTTDDRAKRQWEIKHFYEVFGLRLTSQHAHAPDHIIHELEFMHSLAFWMFTDSPDSAGVVPASAARRKECLTAQRDFLRRHLVRWTPAFCARLKEKAEEPFYIWLAELTSLFLKEDIEWVEERVGEMPFAVEVT